ncbi:MAG: hypothetical protein RIR48_480 [Bacteroidota bacterium]|jgi:hypothetical protein
MKKAIFLIIILSAAAFTSYAQNARMNIYSMGVFDDNVDSYYDNTSYYKGTIRGGYQWGVGFEFLARPNYGAELMYLRLDTKAPLQYYSGGVKNTVFDLGINYIMLAGNRYFSKPGSKVEGFGGAMLGLDITSVKNPDNGKSGSKTFFAWGFRGGANVWATDKVGIKLQAQLLSAVQSVGGGIFFGTGGAGAGLAAYSSMYQFSLGGGLVFRLGQNGTKK